MHDPVCRKRDRIAAARHVGPSLPGIEHLLHVAMAEAGGEVARVVTTERFAPVAAGTVAAFGQDSRTGLHVRADLERALVAVEPVACEVVTIDLGDARGNVV